MAYLGAPYVHGGDLPAGVDCSGLVYRVFRDMAGSTFRAASMALFRTGDPVATPLHIGDLLFFDTTDDHAPAVPTHVGVYAGGDRFVHAASEGPTTGVIVSSLETPTTATGSSGRAASSPGGPRSLPHGDRLLPVDRPGEPFPRGSRCGSTSTTA